MHYSLSENNKFNEIEKLAPWKLYGSPFGFLNKSRKRVIDSPDANIASDGTFLSCRNNGYSIIFASGLDESFAFTCINEVFTFEGCCI